MLLNHTYPAQSTNNNCAKKLFLTPIYIKKKKVLQQ